MSSRYQLEKQVAVSAVVRACSIASSVFDKLVKGETLSKQDKTPVTTADYSVQALINTILARAFPNDPIVGEEDARELRDPSSSDAKLFRERIDAHANQALATASPPWENPEWGVGSRQSIDQLLDAIDRGNHVGGRTGRMWAIDPIDGTKGFLRGGQYAICLALIVDSVVQLAVLGCPNLPISPSDPSAGRGVIVLAARGQGAAQASIERLSSHVPSAATSNTKAETVTNTTDSSQTITSTVTTSMDALFTPISIPSTLPPVDELRVLESVESAHSAQDLTAAIARALDLRTEPNRMDSQAKYAALARGMGEGHLYLRMPVPGINYVEKIWDHAAGNLIVTEAGGIVCDSYGTPLDFGLGRTLGENRGIIACAPAIHAKVLEAIREVREKLEQDNAAVKQNVA